jgi:alanine racemase
MAPGSKNIAVIKANAYGHGLVQVARALQGHAPALAVAFIDEAIQLREAGIDTPILVLQGIHHQDEIAEAEAADIWLMLHHKRQLEWVLSLNTPGPVTVWLKLDTGMHRLGLAPAELDGVCADLIASEKVHRDLVLCTHLASADDMDDPLTAQQISLVRSCAARHGLATSIANSAAILGWPESHADWNRPGYMLYGNSPGSSLDTGSFGLSPAMTLKSVIVATRCIAVGEGVGYNSRWVAQRPSKIGTIAIGYGDGYPRHAPNGTPVLVNGERVPLVGRVSMDALSVDLTDLEKAEAGDPVELWGQQLSVNEVASAAGTIGYQLLAGLTGRVPLDFIQD